MEIRILVIVLMEVLVEKNRRISDKIKNLDLNIIISISINHN